MARKQLSKDRVSSDDDESGTEYVKKEEVPKVKKEPVSEESSPESESESESESSSSSSSDEEEESPEVNQARDDNVQRAIDAKNAQTSNVVPAKPFRPPESFRQVQGGAPPSAEVSQALSNLEGKQVWHITAPASVPLSSIKQLALDAVAQGQPILSHDGKQYRLREEQLGLDTSKHLLVPNKQGNVYHKDSHRVVQTFHLEQLVGLSPSTSDVKPSNVQVSKYEKPVRQQPKNLKTRYRPFGVRDEEDFDMPALEGSDSEAAALKKAQEETKKRKHMEAEDSPSRKKSKTVELPERGRKKEKSGHKSEKKRDETSQERRARKEEKKRKKAQA
ncbi:hypothetical protein KEM55_002160 [Ascosphaera atra]|nr:hypothetical protein KEM55_002160 [Ascosphaera atra]